MKREKIMAIAGVAVIAAPIVTSVTNNMPDNMKELMTNALGSLEKAKLPIAVNPGTVVISKTGNVKKGNFVGTVPTNRVASDNNNVTGGVNVTYKVPISIRSTNGKIFNIPEVKLVANPIITYDGPSTPEKEKVAKEIQAQIKAQIGSQPGVNSSYSGVLSTTIKIPNVDWGMKITPNISVEVGGVKTPVSVPDLITTNKYATNVVARTTAVAKDGTFGVALTETPAQQNDFVNNHSNRKASSVEFTATASGLNSKLELVPAMAKKYGVTFDSSTGKYKVAGDYANNGKEMMGLFKLVAKDPNSLAIGSAVITPSNAVFGKTTEVVPGLLTVSYVNAATSIAKVVPNSNMKPSKDGIVPLTIQNIATVSQSNIMGGGTDNATVTSTTNIGPELDGKNIPHMLWNMYNVSFLEGGRFITSNSGTSLVSSLKAKYIQLPPKYMNILTGGTPEEKYELMDKLINQQLPDVKEVQGAALLFDHQPAPKGGFNLILQPITRNDNTAAYSTSVSYPVMTDKDTKNNTILAKTITFGSNIYDNGSVPTSVFKGINKSTDYLSTNADGTVKGFIASDDNSITVDSVNNGSTIYGYNNGNGQASSVRTGIISHNSASLKINNSVTAAAYIDGQNGKTAPSDWLNSIHHEQFKVFAPNIGVGIKGSNGRYSKGTKLVITQNSPEFSLQGPITIGGVKLNRNQYKVDGNKIIISNIAGISTKGEIDIPIKYTNPSASSVSAKLNIVSANSTNPTGIEYNVNSEKNVPLSSFSNMGVVPAVSANHTQTFTTKNGALHSAEQVVGAPVGTTVTKDNTATLNAEIQNASGESKKYMAIIQVPKNDTPSLAGNNGQPSEGGLSAMLTNIDNKDTPIWVLPKSAVNEVAIPGGLKTNEEMINDTNPYAVAKMQKAIESGKTGWVKYTPGMDLSNIASIAAMPTIKPHSDWTFKYGVKLKGVQNGTFQYTSSEFKYYDETDGVGSVSNVVTLAPSGIDLTHDWSSTAIVKESDGSTRGLSPDELKRTVTFTNSLTGKIQTETLEYLFSHGADLDADYNNTPGTTKDHLQQEVDLVNTQDALAKAGFKLVKTTVKVGNSGATTVDKSFFKSPGIAYNTQFTKVLFVLEQTAPKVSDSVITQVKNADGSYSNVVTGGDGYEASTPTTPGTIPQQGAKGTPLTGASDVKTPTIPVGYKIDQVIVSVTNKDGSITNTTEGPDFKVPTKLGKSNIRYTYQISKTAVAPVHDTVSVTVNGKTVTPKEGGYVAPQIGKDGIPVTGDSGVVTPKIPTPYVITGVKVITHNADGTTTTTEEPPTFKVPTKLGKSNTDYVYNISKQVKDTVIVKVKQPDGTYKEVKVNEPGYVVAQNGAYGLPEKGDSGVKNPVIPKGYQVDSIEVNGKVVASTPEEIKAYLVEVKLGKVDTNYVFNISKEVGSLTKQVIVLGVDGKVIVNDPLTQAETTVQENSS
jgi:hypothetical protein